eukprot:CAMPEP_0168493680 /NCGR_PEP_ID=MMETSP0228-20121227/70843_1 /TAXON_ID=133427 /ORGANISM="Protoceratium reticulatum, Strain CCCM 535 (=CCMP 1889)" /LENGTH=117 /DNA_ID=CAMNT_0008510469 /DNA_START=8 /DNA_END=357 /DNA_ORIENTATION=-
MSVLPTLLTSRPLQLEPDEKPLAGSKIPVSADELPVQYPVRLRVRNTFIDTSAERSPSLEAFYREREVSTCPSSHVGRLAGLFDRLALGPDWQEVDTEIHNQWHPALRASGACAAVS